MTMEEIFRVKRLETYLAKSTENVLSVMSRKTFENIVAMIADVYRMEVRENHNGVRITHRSVVLVKDGVETDLGIVRHRFPLQIVEDIIEILEIKKQLN